MDSQIPNMSHNDSYMSPLQHMNLLNVHHNGVQEFMASIAAIGYFLHIVTISFTIVKLVVVHCCSLVAMRQRNLE